MKDIFNAIDNSYKLTKKLYEKVDDVDTKWLISTLANELANAKVAINVRKAIDLKLKDFDWQKDKNIVDVIYSS